MSLMQECLAADASELAVPKQPLVLEASNTPYWLNLVVVVAWLNTSAGCHVYFFACWHLMGCKKRLRWLEGLTAQQGLKGGHKSSHAQSFTELLKQLMPQMVFSKVLPVKPFLMARNSTPICSLV